MENGDYKKKIDFEKFLIYKFQPTIYSSIYSSSGCGATTLSLLVGVNPYDIPHRSTWEDDYMVKFLRKNKFKVQELTKSSICNRNSLINSISKNHLLLISALFRKKEASWFVIYDNMVYHNYEISDLKPLDFINMPILSAFLLKPPYQVERNKDKKVKK